MRYEIIITSYFHIDLYIILGANRIVSFIDLQVTPIYKKVSNRSKESLKSLKRHHLITLHVTRYRIH